MKRRMLIVGFAVIFGFWNGAGAAEKRAFPGTELLTWEGDIASRMVDGVDKFLLREIDKSVERRARYWKRDFSSAEAYDKSIESNRKALAKMIGVRDARVAFDGPEVITTEGQNGLVGRGGGVDIFAIRWPAFGDVHGEGLMLVPTNGKRVGSVVAIADADQTPEQIVGLEEGVSPAYRYAMRLAQSGYRVVVPVLIDRKMGRHRGAKLTSREFLYRSAFELGRHLIGYEVQKVLAAVDWFAKDSPNEKIGVMGWGEGGMIALYSAALDTRISTACVSGYFDNRNRGWEQPIDRNVFGLLDQFGDAELASMVVPRALIVEACRVPEVKLAGGAGAPARLETPDFSTVAAEVERAKALVSGLKPAARIELVMSGNGGRPFGTTPAIAAFLRAMSGENALTELGAGAVLVGKKIDANSRQERQIHEIDRHNQWLLAESPYVRKEFMKNLNTSSIEKYEKSAAEYRKYFYDEVIGRFDNKPMAFNARTRVAYDNEKWTGYEVVLDVFEDVFAYGILLVPKDIKADEKRPVVVCQHGLEGRPQDVVAGNSPYYHDFAAKLAEQGFVTFAPQNLYIFTDRFRTLQRKANPLKKTLFSVITPQHQQIVDWLKTLSFVDSKRIGFYGLSYGGKTAMRVPALVTDYCLSICSADFNEWVWKNASTRSPYSYVWGGEYEIFEFDLGSTFNYAEMAALIAPRPFMVERGHFDGVAPDEMVGYEFAKVRNLYAARLGIGDRCEIEWFVGPHTINGKGTFEFLRRELKWGKK